MFSFFAHKNIYLLSFSASLSFGFYHLPSQAIFTSRLQCLSSESTWQRLEPRNLILLMSLWHFERGIIKPQTHIKKWKGGGQVIFCILQIFMFRILTQSVKAVIGRLFLDRKFIKAIGKQRVKQCLISLYLRIKKHKRWLGSLRNSTADVVS